MALLFPGGMRVTTTANVAVSGGKCRVRDVNTSNLSSLFSDEAMTIPLTNPVVADSNGMLAAIFCEEGSYDIAFLTAADAVISGQSWEDWSTYTEGSSASIERTLSGARIDIDGGDIGSGSTGVRIQAGDPSPDNSGGKMGLMGWNGTSADAIWLDGTEVNSRRTKSLKEAQKRITEVVYTEATSFSAVTSLTITLPNDPSGTRAWEIEIFDFYTSNATVSLDWTISYDNNSTYKSGASDYAWGFLQSGSLTGDDADSKLRITSSLSGTSSTNTSTITMRVVTPNSGNGNTNIKGDISGPIGAGTGMVVQHFNGAGMGNYGRATHIKVTSGAVTMTGKYLIRTLRGFGE